MNRTRTRNPGEATERKAFLLRIDPEVLESVQRWADDEVRSLNGQIEFILRRALADAKRGRSGVMANRVHPGQQTPGDDA